MIEHATHIQTSCRGPGFDPDLWSLAASSLEKCNIFPLTDFLDSFIRVIFGLCFHPTWNTYVVSTTKANYQYLALPMLVLEVLWVSGCGAGVSVDEGTDLDAC